MGRINNRVNYVTPQTEIVVFQPENNILASITFIATFFLEDGGVQDGGEL